MTRKDIEKAAERSTEKYVENGNLRGFRGSYRLGFIEGADWRINTAWHDASEPPITGKEALVKYVTGDLKIKYRVDVFCGNEWKEMCHYDKLLQFAYIEDLIPNTED